MKLMLPTLMLAAGLNLLLSATVEAATITFANRTLFNLAAPGLPIEDFQEANVGAGGVVQFASPLSASTNNAVFSPGEILPGLTVATSDGSDLVALGAGFVSNTSTVVGPNFFAVHTDLLFTAADAVGFDIWTNSTTTLTVSFFGAGDVLLGSQAVALVFGTPSFFGVINDSGLITRVRITGAAGVGELVDDVAFGTAAAVPEPTTLVLLGSGLALAARRRLRRRN